MIEELADCSIKKPLSQKLRGFFIFRAGPGMLQLCRMRQPGLNYATTGNNWTKNPSDAIF
jgi:hypothetical protein